MQNGALFEIHLHTGSVVADVHDYSWDPNEMEVLIVVDATFALMKLSILAFEKSRVKLSYASSSLILPSTAELDNFPSWVLLHHRHILCLYFWQVIVSATRFFLEDID
jgi:hypothetical protein